MTELAKEMGVKLKFVPTEWKTLINGIMADKYDISTSASVTPQRIRTVGFTKSYYQVTTVPLTLKKNLAQFKDWEDINYPSVTLTVTLGTSQEQYVENVFSPINHRFTGTDPKANELTVTVYRPLEIYTVLVLEYLILILIVSWMVRRLESRLGANLQTAHRS